MFDLTDRRALITGASGDIGEAIARAFHGQGAIVALTGTRADRLEALAASLGERAYVVAADLADAAAADALVARAEAALAGGRADGGTAGGAGLDILVNNAGLTRDGLLMRMKDEDWSRVIEVNLTAGFRLARAALRGMIKRRFGRIIGVTSVVGVTGNAGQANYAASKAGMIGFSKALAQEVAGRAITVNAIAPGFVATAMTAALSEAQRAKSLEAVPLGRFGAPAEIAAAAVYLASDEAAYVTGATLHVNGGIAMI